MRVVKRGLVVALLALAFPANALAGPCGLPDAQTLWIDFGTPDLRNVFVRPGTILAVSTGNFPAEARAAGSQTIYWDMNLNNRVGTPTAPADPALMDERANRLFVFAASQTGCATPWIVLNELFGSQLETPWTPNNAQYRANVLALMRGLAARGARPFLLLSQAPYTGEEEADNWWRAVAQVGDIVPEVYPSARSIWASGAIVGNRRLRASYRRAVANLVSIGIPISKLGLILGFQSAPGTGGREGLRPRQAWFEVIKWQALSARQVAAEMKIPTVFSWGWGTFSEAGIDPDKADAGCVWLWTRDPSLCNGPAVAGKGFSTSRRQGQLMLSNGAMCRIGPYSIRMDAIARLNRMVQDRDVAYTALLQRLAAARHASVSMREVLAAERAIVSRRFGGRRSSYLAALGAARANLDVARGVIADELRRRKLAARMRVSRPSYGAIAGFYATYPELQVRALEASPAPWWLDGRRAGLALSSLAPPQVFDVPSGRRSYVRTTTGTYFVRPLDVSRPLGSVPLSQARPAIAAALRYFAQSEAVLRWSAAQQTSLLREAVCRRDDLPAVGTVDLQDFLPFLALNG
jgi:hypothetical protein